MVISRMNCLVILNVLLEIWPQDATNGYYMLCMKPVLVAKKGKGALKEPAKGWKHKNENTLW